MSSFEDYFNQNIGEKIRKYRLLSGDTQEELSAKLGKNEKYIGHIERCERKISNKVLILLLDMWEIQPKDFFNFDVNYDWKSLE